MEKLSIDGAYVLTPRIFTDDRGHFLEWFRGAEFAADLGHRLDLAQANISVSRRGAVRGVHFADVPPGQAKYVTCVRGVVLDAVIDIRVGSPTFGVVELAQLDDREPRAVYMGEGLGHAFMALTDDATVVYLCSQPYAPEREHEINPLDPALGIDWPGGMELLISEKDAAAPTLAQAEQAGLLPSYEACLAYVQSLKST